MNNVGVRSVGVNGGVVLTNQNSKVLCQANGGCYVGDSGGKKSMDYKVIIKMYS